MKKTLHSDTKSNDRRQFLAGLSLSAVAGVVATLAPRLSLAADLPHLTLDDPTAKALGYTEDSASVDAAKFPMHQAGMACSNCNFFQGGSAAYGPCQIYSGKSVNAKGWCSGYAKKA
jgi:hypothetical protein